MHCSKRWEVVIAVALSLATLLYGAKAAAFFDFGGNALLADLLANATRQLAVATQSLGELRRSYAEVKRVAEYADDAAGVARSFQQTAAARLGGLQSQLDAAFPDLETYRREAFQTAGAKGRPWAAATGQSGASGPGPLAALQATFGADKELQANVVDAEVSATLRGGASQSRVAALQKEQLKTLLRLCNARSGLGSLREARQFAEECGLAAEQAQLLHLQEGQETNRKLGEIARLQALAIEQKNAELRRELAEQDARREALTAGVAALSRQRVAIRVEGGE